jgi:toxin ParE1/3/4
MSGHLLDEIDSVCKMLARAPLLGRAREELGPRLRSFSVGDYLIFYQPKKNGIAVVRVLSGYRALDSLFNQQQTTLQVGRKPYGRGRLGRGGNLGFLLSSASSVSMGLLDNSFVLPTI